MGKYILYCRETCYFSNEAKKMIHSLGKKCIVNTVKNNYNEKELIKNNIRDIIGDHNTFPIIYYKKSNGNNIFIGGYTDLVTYINNKDI